MKNRQILTRLCYLDFSAEESKGIIVYEKSTREKRFKEGKKVICIR